MCGIRSIEVGVIEFEGDIENPMIEEMLRLRCLYFVP
jgi:hypothetical protein